MKSRLPVILRPSAEKEGKPAKQTGSPPAVSQLPQNTLSHISDEGVPRASRERDLLLAFPDPDGQGAVVKSEHLDFWTGPALRAEGELLRDMHGNHLLSLSLQRVNLSGNWKVKGIFHRERSEA